MRVIRQRKHEEKTRGERESPKRGPLIFLGLRPGFQLRLKLAQAQAIAKTQVKAKFDANQIIRAFRQFEKLFRRKGNLDPVFSMVRHKHVWLISLCLSGISLSLDAAQT